MRIGKLYIILTVIFFTISSCQKELVPDSFYIGCSEGVTVRPLDNTFADACYGEEEVIELDVDEDGELDLKFYTYAMDSLGDQHKRGSSVWSLDGDIEFGYFIKYEDLFSVRENSDYRTREIIYNERSHFNCPHCLNLGHRKDKFSFSSPVMLDEGSGLSKDIKWSDKMQILSQLDQSRQFSKEKNNTQIYNNILTGIWNKEGEGYIPFRKKSSFGRYQYGWIKIKVTDHRRIELFEIGIQDNTH